MTWTQLGLALGPLPERLSPKAKAKYVKKRGQFKGARVKAKLESKSKPIKKAKKEKYVVLAPGELDDDVTF